MARHNSIGAGHVKLGIKDWDPLHVMNSPDITPEQRVRENEFIHYVMEGSDLFTRDCCGWWMTQIDWDFGKGHLVFVGENPGDEGLVPDTVQDWVSGLELPENYYEITNDVAKVVFWCGEIYNDAGWEYIQIKINEAVQRAFFKEIRYE